MKTLVRRLPSLKALLVSAFVLFVLLVINDQMLSYAAKSNPSSRVNWLFQSEPANYEIAVLGSSMAKEGIDPGLLAKSCGLPAEKVVQLAWGGRGVSEQSLYFELFLERHGCKLLLLELHPRGLESDVLERPLDEFRYLARLNDPIVFRHLSRQFGELQTRLWQRVPMWGFALFSTQVGWHDVLAVRRGEVFEPNRIELREHEDLNEQHVATLQKQRGDPGRNPGFTQISSLSQEQFAEIVELCKQRGIQLLAFVPPIYESIDSDEWLKTYREILGSDIVILRPSGDYLHESKAFVDSLHVNARGRRQFTQELAGLVIGNISE